MSISCSGIFELVLSPPLQKIILSLGNLFLIDDTKDSAATNTHGVDAATFKKAQDYVSKGGNINAIKQKYTLTPEQEKQLTTL